MASYKVIQDIEAEDKLLGPLSLRQFIYAVIVVVLGFLMFTLGKVNPLLALPFLLPAILFGFLAAPFGHDQSSEVWLLAKIRFILKPRARVWNQAGLQELVTITAPKTIERVLTNGLDQYQVQSRLQALARTIDTRGWAVKGVDMAMLPANMPRAITSDGSDRLIDMQNMASAVPDYDVSAENDILDAASSPVAQQVDQLIQASTNAHRQAILEKMTHPSAAPAQAISSVPLMSYQTPSTTTPQQVTPMYTDPSMADPAISSVPPQIMSTQAAIPVLPALPVSNDLPTADEAALLEHVHEEDEREADALKRMHVLQQNQAAPAPTQPEPSSVTQTPDAGILELANNDDLTVATIARQAHKHDPPANNEVVISLH